MADDWHNRTPSTSNTGSWRNGMAERCKKHPYPTKPPIVQSFLQPLSELLCRKLWISRHHCLFNIYVVFVIFSITIKNSLLKNCNKQHTSCICIEEYVIFGCQLPFKALQGLHSNVTQNTPGNFKHRLMYLAVTLHSSESRQWTWCSGIFGKTANGVLPYVLPTCVRRRSFVDHEVSSWYISRTVWPWITKFHADPTLQPHMTPLAAFGRHLSKFDKRPKMPPPTALGRILVARRFACPTKCWASCYYYYWDAHTRKRLEQMRLEATSESGYWNVGCSLIGRVFLMES